MSKRPPLFSRLYAGETVKAYLYIVVGCALGALAYPLFLTPNHIAPGGLTGVGTILNYLFGAPVGLTSMALNLPLFLIGYRQMGRVFVFRSLVATVLFSAMIDLMAVAPLTQDILLGSVYGGILLGVGLGLIFRGGATTGGSDMVARMVHARVPFITVGVFLFAVDCLVIVAAGIFMEAHLALYALICIFVSSRVVDVTLAGFGNAKACFVISDGSERISTRVMTEMERGVTLLAARGAYSGQARHVLLSVVGRSEVGALKSIVREEDPRAFMFIAEANEVLGEGFRRLHEDD